MPKPRNASTDAGMFAQWLARKCRNHHPLQELKLQGAARKTAPDRYKVTERGNVSVLKDAENVVIYDACGKCFRITVEEVDLHDYPPRVRAVVGY